MQGQRPFRKALSLVAGRIKPIKEEPPTIPQPKPKPQSDNPSFYLVYVIHYESHLVILPSRDRIKVSDALAEVNAYISNRPHVLHRPGGACQPVGNIALGRYVVMKFHKHPSPQINWFNFKDGQLLTRLTDEIENNCCLVFFTKQQHEYYEASGQIPVAPRYTLTFGMID